MTWARESTLMSCSLSPGSLRPFDTIRSKANEVASLIGSDGSDSNVNRRGIVLGVTVRLISIQPDLFLQISG